MTNLKALKEFVTPFYEGKDSMHSLAHIKRILNLGYQLSSKYENRVDKRLILYGAYFHGIIYKEEKKVLKFLEEQGLSEKIIMTIVKVAWESQKDQIAETLEGKILNDAHMIEGGKTFLIVKSLVTGTARGQSLEQTIDYIEQYILGHGKCYLPETQRLYKEKQDFAKTFIRDLKEGLTGYTL